MSDLSKVLLVIPHSGLIIPPEIPLNKVRMPAIHRIYKDATIDRYTDQLYNFLSMTRIIFDYHRIFIDVNCNHLIDIEDILPSYFEGIKVYNGWDPTKELRNQIVKKYICPFHKQIEMTDKRFILECHSSEKGSTDDNGKRVKKDIYLCDGQTYDHLPDKPDIKSAPSGLIEEYASQIRKIDKRLSVGINELCYDIYGSIMDFHGIKNGQVFDKRVPLLLQETTETYYMKFDYVDARALTHLNRVCSEALTKALCKFKII